MECCILNEWKKGLTSSYPSMWRGDDASRCVSASTVGDDVTSCDELARTTDVGGVY